MSSYKLRNNLLSLDMEIHEEEQEDSTNEVEVVADSYEQALDIATQYLSAEEQDLEVHLLERGSKGFLGFFKIPYKYKFFNKNVEEKHHNYITGEDVGHAIQDNNANIIINENGRVVIRIYKMGAFIKVVPPSHQGIPIDIYSVLKEVKQHNINRFDEEVLKKIVKEKKNTFIKFANFKPRKGAESRISIQVSEDKLNAYISITKPYFGGRHLLPVEVVNTLKNQGIIFGINENKIEESLDYEIYHQKILVAEGIEPKNGTDGKILYKFRVDKRKDFNKDESGNIDYLSQNMIENVIKGQVLAELIPPEKGIEGVTIFNEKIPVKDGKPTIIKGGEGTLLIENGAKMIAERNGQALLRQDKVIVEKVYSVLGDVGLNTGNIMFLGTVVVSGSVEDNTEIKANGNIDIIGNVQKAHLEAEGDIIMRGGMQGRQDGFINSTGGSIYAKFIQNAIIKTSQNLYVSEGIMHSQVQSGEKIICYGKRAQVVGGELIATEEIRVKQLGAQASTPTHVIVGINPQYLEYQKQLQTQKKKRYLAIESIEKNLKTLRQQQIVQRQNFPPEKEAMLKKEEIEYNNLKESLEHVERDLHTITEKIKEATHRGAVHVEKRLYPGVTVEINNAKFIVRDEYSSVSFIEENGSIKIIPFKKMTKEEFASSSFVRRGVGT